MRRIPVVLAAMVLCVMPVTGDSQTCSGGGDDDSCSAPPTSRLLSLTCSGSLEIFPELPYGLTMDISKQLKLANAGFAQLQNRLKCHCPKLTDTQFFDRFSPARSILNLLSGKPEFEEDISCLDGDKTYTRDLHKYLKAALLKSEITLPDTCTREAFVGEEGCRFEMNTFSNLTANLKVAAAECEGGLVPSLGVWCSGAGCESLFKPCGAAGCGDDGQECVVGEAGIKAFIGDLLPSAHSLMQDYFGVNTTILFDHLIRLVDGDIDSDRSIEDCEDTFTSFSTSLITNIASSLGLINKPTGICLPKQWAGFKGLKADYYNKWEKMSAMPRKDECSPLSARTDSDYGWRRGQVTPAGQSGGGWCLGYEDCNFHRSAGDCESDDDFEYFMGKLYCKYKKQHDCGLYAPYCKWNPREKGKYKCVFNETTQLDGIDKKADWLRGLKCSDMDGLAKKCDAATEPLRVCEMDYCACQGGKWDNEENRCDQASKDGKKCKDMVQCWGGLQQCYEKSSEEGVYNRNVRGCEQFFMCRCTEQAAHWGCDPKAFCGRRCACLYSDKDRFVGPHCDLRLIRGETPTIFTFDEDTDAPIPVHPWSGDLAGDYFSAAAFLRSQEVDPSLRAPRDNSATGAEPLLVTSCEGRVWVLPKSPLGFSFHLRGLEAVAEGAVKSALASFRCAIEGVSDDDTVALQQFAEAFLLNTPQIWVTRFFAGYTEKGFFTLGTLADYVFNLTEESEPFLYPPQDLGAQAESELPNNRAPVEGGGWVPHLRAWVNDGVSLARSTTKASLRYLGLMPDDQWYVPLLELFDNQNEQERNAGIKSIIFGRQQELVERQQSKSFPSYQWEGKVRVPDNFFTHMNGKNTKIGLSTPLRRGNVDMYFAQCPTHGLAEVQIGASGALSDAIHMRKTCKKDKDCGPEAEAQCRELEGTMFSVDMYHLDFVSGFLWGGNFTKGRLTGCSILSTTVNQLDFSTAKPQCSGNKLWKKNLGALFGQATGNKVKEGRKPTYCHISGEDIVNELTQTPEEGDVDLAHSTVLTDRPFSLPDLVPKASSMDEL